MEGLSISFHKKLILRTPHFAFTRLLNDNTLIQLLNNDVFMEAIYLASPTVYAQSIKWKQGELSNIKDIEKLKATLTQYYKRMYSRCTPFGLFAGCSVVDWSSKTKLAINESEFFRQTRLDMHYLCALAQYLSNIPYIKERLIFKTNNSYYMFGDKIRYVEYKYVEGKRIHRISSVNSSTYLIELLKKAKHGILYNDAVQLLKATGVSSDEAINFLNEVINNQLLISELDATITGQDYLRQIILILNRISENNNKEIQEIISQLTNIEAELKSLDFKKVNKIESYKNIINKATTFEIPIEENKFFQVDFFRESKTQLLENGIQKNIIEAIELLNNINPIRPNQNLLNFAKEFAHRYQDATVPLLEILDAESGLGYPINTGVIHSVLTQNINVTTNIKPSTIPWNEKEEWLFKLLLNATQQNKRVVDLLEEKIPFTNKTDYNLPLSMSVFFSIKDKDLISIESISGSSAINLMARFGDGNKIVKAIAKDIANWEQRTDFNKIYAEIVHLPEARVGNVLLHPPYRKYEIPYLAQPTVKKSNVIYLKDVLIKVVNGQIILLSQKLKKQIIPRLSNAHNYSKNSLPAYHFLCDLQFQNYKGSLHFGWGSLSNYFSFLPRVVYKGCILFKATWMLKAQNYNTLLNSTTITILQNARNLVEHYKLPQYCVLSDGDNELMVDFENITSLEAFVKTIKNKEVIILKEFLQPSTKLFKNTVFENQFIATVFNNGAKKVDYNFNGTIFLPPKLYGKEWLYHKIYCGKKIANEILAEAIYPLAKKLIDTNTISQWFFIRYNEGGNHIRLRFKINSITSTVNVNNQVLIALKKYIQNNNVTNLQHEIYKPEIERYGINTISFAEQFFYFNSVTTIANFSVFKNNENLHWLFGLVQIDELLGSLNFSLQEKVNLLERLKTNFANEFSLTKIAKLSINKIYADNRSKILDTLNNKELYFVLPFKKQVKDNCNEILAIKQNGKLNVDWSSFISSIIHMQLNRLFFDLQRLNEAIVYDLLYKHYMYLKSTS